MPYGCSVPNCKGNYANGPKVSVFSFPEDEIQKQKWIQAICRDDFKPTSNSKVCELHFKQQDVERETSMYDSKTGRLLTAPLSKPRLVKGAVPSVFPKYPTYRTKITARREDPEDRTRKENEQLSLEGSVVPSSEASQSKKWLINTRRADLMKKDTMYLYNNIKICALHFEDSQFMNTEKKRLVWNAVPTLFDVPNKPPTITLKRKLPNRCTVPAKKKQKARHSRSVGVGGEASPAASENSSVKEEAAADYSESTSATAEQVCSGVASKVEQQSERDEISCEDHKHEECERITVKVEPEAEHEDHSSEEWRTQECERITVKVEPVVEYEENSSEEWRTQEPEFVEVKGEPLEADEATDSGGTQYDGLSAW